MSPIQHKINIKEKVAKRSLKVPSATLNAGPFWEPFSIKIDEKINAKIDTEKVMKIDEISMWK